MRHPLTFMELTRTEEALINAIRTCRHKGFYNQVRWQFLRKISSTAALTNSLKASFCRTKRQLEAKGIIKQHSVFTYELTDEEFVDYATYIGPSEAILEHRKILLPIVIARSTAAEFGNRANTLSEAEKEIFDHLRWDKIKTSDLDLRKARDELTPVLHKAYEIIAPAFSDIFKSDSWHKRDIELLFCKLALAIQTNRFFYGTDDKSFVDLFIILRTHFLDSFSNDLFAVIAKYEKLLGAYANVFVRHRRRIFFNRHVNGIRYFARSDDQQIHAPLTGAKKKMDEQTKHELLEEVYLTPDDLEFMKSQYNAWTSTELKRFLANLLKIPDGKSKVLTETVANSVGPSLVIRPGSIC